MADAAAAGTAAAAGAGAATEGEERDPPAVVDDIALTAADVVRNANVRDGSGQLMRKRSAASCYDVLHELSDTDHAKEIKAT